MHGRREQSDGRRVTDAPSGHRPPLYSLTSATPPRPFNQRSRSPRASEARHLHRTARAVRPDRARPAPQARGGYKDTVTVHFAHHLLVFLGPNSPLFAGGRAQPGAPHWYNGTALRERHRLYRLPPRLALGLFSCRTPADGDEPECGAPRPAANATARTVDRAELRRRGGGDRFPARLVEVVAGAPRETCDAACARAGGRVCAEWAAAFAHAATRVRVGDAAGDAAYRRREFPACTADEFLGPLLHSPRWDLPALESGAGPDKPMTVGPMRIFRCDAVPRRRVRRVCPCLNRTAAEARGSVGLF